MINSICNSAMTNGDKWILGLLAAVALPTTLLAGTNTPKTNIKPSPAGIKFFETNVRPVLANRCFKCHGAKKQRGGLRLDSLAAILKGGDSGPAVKPGDIKTSLLVRAIGHREKLQMPPKSKLPPQEIANLTMWVNMGAPWPNAVVKTSPKTKQEGPAFTKEQKSHWSFQRPAVAKIPTVKNHAWVKSPIDVFILAGLEAKDLRPAPHADKRTLLRRATFDLIGLPPTPDEIDAFLNNESPNAFAKVIDRLLDSPHYGERWGRHWLDVVRYADSNGMDENLAFVNAFRYRDYVVRSFNADKPFNRLVQEQMAGDLMPDAGGDGIIATGFLSIGPKMLAEDDPVKMEMDIIDEQIDTIGRAFMGLTLGCARCHDHKFDPISAEDYYALAGILKSTHTMDNHKVVAKWHERPAASAGEQAKSEQRKQKIDSLTNAVNEIVQAENDILISDAKKRVAAYIKAARQLQHFNKVIAKLKPLQTKDNKTAGLIILEAENFVRGNVKKDFTGYGKKIGVIYNKGQLPNVAEYDVTARVAGMYQLDIRYAAAAARPVKLFVDGQLVKENAAGNVTGSWNPDTQKWAVEGVFQLKKGKNTIRLECAGPFPHFDKLALAPRDFPKDFKTAGQLATENRLNPAFLRQWLHFISKSKTPSEKIINDAKGPFAIPADAENHYSQPGRKRLQQLRSDLAMLQKQKAKTPMAMAVAERKTVDARLHIRGSHLTLGETVARRFPTVFAGTNQSPLSNKQSGRLALAKWLTQPDHPLTARVMVNRIWQGHFGTALVRSPNNFGLLGERPTNQPLLDWLALRFVKEGWSIKAMHRLIMLSNAYQMSTAFNEKAARIDPENLLYWRMNRRRLEAEAVRDAILAISGQLNRKVGGSTLVAKPRAYVTGTANSNYTKYDINRRSIYLPVVRSALFDVFQAFDFPDPSFPSGARVSSTGASQALFMMNSEFVHKHTKALAVHLLKAVKENEQVDVLYTKLYGRPPSDQERERATAFVQRLDQAFTQMKMNAEERRLRSWQSLCRVLMSANEFVYLE